MNCIAGADKIRRDRMPIADMRNFGPQSLFRSPCRSVRPVRISPRAVWERLACVAQQAGCRQHRAAFFDITDDVFEVEIGQHATTAIPIENDQIELVDLDLEQFSDRKRYQGQLPGQASRPAFRAVVKW